MSSKEISMIAVNRERVIVKTSIIGIVTNILLAVFKAVIGIASNSIAVTLDAVNNISDAMSSVITIIGAKLGAKKPDKKHPHGYGRIEYLSSMIVAAIVLYAGITSMVESVKKIIHPEEADYATISLIIISVAIIIKLILGNYVKKQGEKVNSVALVASGSEASFDAILSASVLASAIVYIVWGTSLEAYVGVLISIFIIKTGIEMMIETLNDIIGHRGDGEINAKIKDIFSREEEVRGTYDLNLFNYGPDKYYGSAHIELPDTMTVNDVDLLTRKIQLAVYQETGVIMTGIGVYSYNTTDDEVGHIRNLIQKTVMSHDWALQLHGFYVDKIRKIISFDVVISFDIGYEEAVQILYREVREIYPDYELQIVTDIDVMD